MHVYTHTIAPSSDTKYSNHACFPVWTSGGILNIFYFDITQ